MAEDEDTVAACEERRMVPFGFWQHISAGPKMAFQMMMTTTERLIEDTVPTMFSFLDSGSLMTAAAVSRAWRKVAVKDDFWYEILKTEFSIEADSLRPPPRPLRRLWFQMRRTFRSLLVASY